MSVSLPPHMHEPLRREIAENYARGELRKLLPHLKDGQMWETIDAEVGQWYERLAPENFWNAVHGLSIGLRLKSIVPILTSQNMAWEQRDIDVNELWFGGRFGPIGTLDCSEAASEVAQCLAKPENKKLHERELTASDERSGETAARDHFPIFVVLKRGKYRVIDGNRRLLRAILKRQTHIAAAVGEPQGEPTFYEHWVPTSLLVDLVFWHKRNLENGLDTTEETARLVYDLVRDSAMGRYEFEHRAIHKGDEVHEKLFKAVCTLY